MKQPKTINGLMRHLRDDCGIAIGGSYEKLQLKSYGYFHGYKGYRFYRKNTDRIPFSNFKEVMALIEYDNIIKSLLYPNLMFLETAVKNIICSASIEGLKKASFDYVFRERMNDNLTNAKVQAERLKLRNKIYSEISSGYSQESNKDNQMIRHFYDKGEDIPVWVGFELMYLSDIANFFKCLNKSIRRNILKEIDMFDVSVDTNLEVLDYAIITIKALRNAVAHNAIIFDARFKDRKINNVLQQWLRKETNINGITLESLVDYIIILCFLIKRFDYTGMRAKELVQGYIRAIDNLKSKVSDVVFNKVFPADIIQKNSALQAYIQA